MDLLSIHELSRAIQGEVGQDLLNDPSRVGAISTDSRTVRAGDCFFAIQGPTFDGHDFVEQALDKGAVCAVVREDCVISSKRVMRVPDTIKALGDLARWYRQRMGFKIVAITGSAGKTTTREIVHYVLSRQYRCHQAGKSYNNAIGLPLTILWADQDREVVIVELGSNAPGEIAYLTGIACPDIAVVTNTLPAHLEGFGTLEAIVEEKASIVSGLRAGGIFLINGDQDILVKYCRQKELDFSSFGCGKDCDIRAVQVCSEGNHGRLTVEGVSIEVPLCGRANVLNVLAAWAVCRQFGVSVTEFAGAVSSFQPVSMRLQIEKAGPLLLLNDCYNANPASMANALECLELVAEKEHRRSLFVCGTMAELGAESERLHEILGAQAAHHGVRTLLATGPFGPAVARGFAGIRSGAIVEVFETTDLLCDNLQGFVQPDDIVLVKGSRSARLEKAVRRLEMLFGSAQQVGRPA
ncbi:MAG: UDP-N-acetylmuramoyl-tripeptide--D-alanyl-D-alanine ligase [Sedimentisphaerales bacterium]|nr:UDP-N-acetylmuramoyl-tripeptide--D-alanyl-D-alanine ligase [Sedimentisphaerales bacterium]